jgi:hypothetical protein
VIRSNAMIENKRRLSCVLLPSLVSVSCFVHGCDKHQNSRGPVSKFDAYFTWTGFDGLEGSPEQAIFSWNGEVVGPGKIGFSEIISRLKKLPEGSTVLEYPNYNTLGEEEPSGPYREMPFFRDMVEALRGRRVIVIISGYDHKGTYVGRTRRSTRLDFSKSY